MAELDIRIYQAPSGPTIHISNTRDGSTVVHKGLSDLKPGIDETAQGLPLSFDGMHTMEAADWRDANSRREGVMKTLAEQLPQYPWLDGDERGVLEGMTTVANELAHSKTS